MAPAVVDHPGLEVLCRLHAWRGEVVQVPTWPHSFSYFFGPAANEFVFANDHLFTWREAFKTLIPVDGETALIVSDGPDHTRRRALVRPALHHRRVQNYVATMAAAADEALDSAGPGPFDAYAVFRAAIRRSTVRSLFGDRVAAHEHEVGQLLQPLFDLTDRLQTIGAHQRLRTPLWRRAMSARDRLDEFVHAEIARARAAPDHGGGPVLDLLVHGRDGAGSGLSDLEVRDQVVSLIAAGYETTSGAMAWMLLSLASRPDLVQDVRDEILLRCGHEPLGWDDLQELPLLEAVVTESLRLHPPATISARHVAHDFDYAGHHVRAGRLLVFSPYVTHRSPDVYDRAREFRPERWLDGARRPANEYLPFGGGAHRCIGSGMATTELTVMLARLLARGPYQVLERRVRATSMAAMRPARGLRIQFGS